MYNKYNIQYDRRYLLTAPYWEFKSLSRIDIFPSLSHLKYLSPEVELAWLSSCHGILRPFQMQGN